MKLINRLVFAWRRQRLALAVRDLAWMERNASKTLAGQRARIADLQHRIARDAATTRAADIARDAERGMKRSLLA